MYFFITYVSKMSNAEGVSEKFFRHPLKITLPPPGRNPENAAARNLTL